VRASKAHKDFGVSSVDLGRRVRALDLAEADQWRLLVLRDGVPFAYPSLPNPGRTSSPAFTRAVLAAHAEWLEVYEDFLERFRRRLGAPRDEWAPLTCSVVVCTHRRPRYVPDLLGALERLDPAPDEIVVVDNDPGELDCRAEVERAGARYVREDRRGLDNARNTGLEAARCELVAFTDDDCVPAVTWLRELPELFDDPLVGAVTGPGFAYSLDTPAQQRFEAADGFRRGLARRTWDWTVLSPVNASRVGAGANMIFRREAVDRLGLSFPPELDAGTPTESGGDMYALYKVLAGGYRVVYDPATYVFHQHRPEAEALRRTIRGYGVGLTAALAKLMVEEGEVSAPAAWAWLPRQFRDVLRGALAGSADREDVLVGWDYLRGGAVGLWAWRTALGQVPPGARRRPARPPAREEAAPASGDPLPPVGAAPAPGPAPLVSVIVPTYRRPEALGRCLDALGAQTVPRADFEVVVVDDSPPGERLAAHDVRVPPGMRVRRLESGSRGAAAARNAGAAAAAGALLLFLDDDLVPAPGLLARHLERQAPGADRIVVGYSPPRPRGESFAAMRSSAWWEDHFRRKRHAATLTFVDVLSGNMSVPRAAYERLGGFDVSFGRFRREDWDWGVRALSAGFEVAYDHEAVARHEFTISSGGRLAAARREGHGDALMLGHHPFVAPSLPSPRAGLRLLRRPVRGLGFLLLQHEGPRAGALLALDALERLKLRRHWGVLYGALQRAAYEQGMREGRRGRPWRAPEPFVLRVEVASDEPILLPPVSAPVIELTLDGRPAGRVRPVDGQWDGELAERAASALMAEGAWSRLAAERARVRRAARRGHNVGDAAVVFGPGREHWDERHAGELRALGCAVEVLEGERSEHWTRVDRAVRESDAEVVALPLPGTVVAPEWIGPVRLALDPEDVAVAFGAGVAPAEAPPPLTLLGRSAVPLPFAPLGEPPEWLAVRRALYEELGGLDPSLAALGPHGPLLDLVERALDGGHVVAYGEVPGVENPADARRRRRRREKQRRTARAGLMYRHAAALGGLRGALWLARFGVLPLLHSVARGLSPDLSRGRYALRSTRAFLRGCRLAARLPAPREDGLAGTPDALPFDRTGPSVQDGPRQQR
jgi:glycosyltransferase involved in cell wall biosynthesis